MANSGSFNTSAYSFTSGTRYLTFSWKVTSQHIASRQTVISWELVGNGTYQYNPKCGGFKVKINDEVVYEQPTSYRINVYIGTVIASGTKTFTHDANGNCSFSAYAEAGIYTVAVNCTGQGSWDLPRIPQKSTLTVQNGTLGTSQKITVNRDSTELTHSITYVCGETSGRICTKSSSTSITWTPPIELAEQKPYDTSLSITFTIQTFVGSAADATDLGTSTATATYQIPNSVAPYFEIATSDITDNYDIFGAYIQGHSKLSMTVTGHGSYGSWVTSYKIVFDGKTYTTDSFTTDVISSTGNLTATITVTDSRGRNTTSTKTITVLAYEYPKITALSAYRSNSDGSTNKNGSYMTVKFSSTVQNPNSKNGAWFKVQYKKSTESSYTEVTLNSYTGSFNVSNGTYTFAADTSSYDIILLVGDKIKTVQRTTTGASLSHIMSFLKKNGQIVGMAFGKIAEHENTLEIGWALKVTGGDAVVEQGTSGSWTYRKWDSGVAECWMTLEHSTALSTAWGAMYSGTATTRQSYPFTFTSRPTETATLTARSYQALLFPEKDGNGLNSSTKTACYNVCRPSSITTASDFYINIHVVGNWK